MSLILSGTEGLSDVDGTAATPAIRGTDANTGIFFPAADTIAFSRAGSESLRLNSAGNIGLGTTPSPWSGFTVYQQTNASIATTGGEVYFGQNWYWNGSSDVYIGNFHASRYQQITGEHRWYTAPAGTAGNPITFTQRMTLTETGRLGIGTTSPTQPLDVNGEARIGPNRISGQGLELNEFGTGDRPTYVDFHCSGNPATLDFSARVIRSSGVNGIFEIFNTGTGAINVTANTAGVQLTNGATAWAALSDERHKDIIEPIENAAQKVSTLRAVIGKYKTDEPTVRRSFLIAQDVQAVLPEAVSDGDPDNLSLRYTEVIPLLVAAIKEQQAMIDQLKAEVAALKAAR